MKRLKISVGSKALKFEVLEGVMFDILDGSGQRPEC